MRASNLVVVETIPESLRASHAAAGNSGSWPHNGAERIVMDRADAEELVEHDPEWSEILEGEDPADYGDNDETMKEITDEQIEALRSEAAQAGDTLQVALCDVALASGLTDMAEVGEHRAELETLGVVPEHVDADVKARKLCAQAIADDEPTTTRDEQIDNMELIIEQQLRVIEGLERKTNLLRRCIEEGHDMHDGLIAPRICHRCGYIPRELCARADVRDQTTLEEQWWAWHDEDYSRWEYETVQEAEIACAAWVRGESDVGPDRNRDDGDDEQETMYHLDNGPPHPLAYLMRRAARDCRTQDLEALRIWATDPARKSGDRWLSPLRYRYGTSAGQPRLVVTVAKQ
jgi:hypothetical protein